MLGCISSDVDDSRIDNAVRYASCIGRAFQITDDILDVEGDEESLGKPIGSDAECDKTTFVTELGLEGAKAEARRLTDEAVKCIAQYKGADNLTSLALWLCDRKN